MTEILIILACVPLYVCNAMCDKTVSSQIAAKYSGIYNCLKFVLCGICVIPFLAVEKISVVGMGTFLCGSCCACMYAISKTVILKGYEATSVAFMTLCHAAGMIVPCLLGHFLWAEKLSFLSGLGIFLTVAAIVLLKDAVGDNKKLNAKGILYGMVTLLTSAGVMVAQKCMGVYFPEESPGLYNLIAFAGTALILCPLVKPQEFRKETRKVKRTVGICALGSACALAIISIVMTSLASNVPSVILFPLFNGTGIILVCVVSALVFREKLTAKKLAGLLAGLVGLYMINL